MARESENIRRYFQDLNKCKPLTHAEEYSLYERMKNGDSRAVENLIRANLRFVVSVAMQYNCRGVDLEDLIQVGNRGLLKALKHFDGTKNFKFSSYAVWWIRQEILTALSEQTRGMRLNCFQTNRHIAIQKAAEKFEQEFHRQPTKKNSAMKPDYPSQPYCWSSRPLPHGPPCTNPPT